MVHQYPLHELMSRTGSFPLRRALALIETHGSAAHIILDPFCGKGTTLLAGRILQKETYGLDVAPEAVICSTAKLLTPSSHEFITYIRRLRVRRRSACAMPSAVRTFFHGKTLEQLLGVRAALLADLYGGDPKHQHLALFGFATVLGILHGHASYSLSVRSAHAYSMSPQYVRRYARLHGLRKPLRDVKECIIAKATKCLANDLPESPGYAVARGSALALQEHFPDLIGRVDLILTSPPYLNAQTYSKDNWLRLWFLGFDRRVVRTEYIETASRERYAALMHSALHQMAQMLRPGGRLVCVAGAVRIRKRQRGRPARHVTIRTADIIQELCSTESMGLNLETVRTETVMGPRRYFHALNGSNGHRKQDLMEDVVVAVKERR